MAIVEAAARILEEIAPASVRAVCYRLFTEGLIPNMSKASTDKVSRLLVDAREQERIPWASIVDETREVEQAPSWDNPESLIRAAVSQYRKDYWKAQPNHVEVWSEKGTVRGALAPVLNEYGVAFRVMHGYGSATAVRNIAETSFQSSKPFFALYVGDWDPSGLHMSEVDLPTRIEEYSGDVAIYRVALNAIDTEAGLPSFDAETKSGDPRHRWFTTNYGPTCWELDALSPVILRQRVEHAIVRLLDRDQWDNDVAVEKVEQESMRDVLGTWSNLRQAAICSRGGTP
ncbi:MAG: hypothetical protein IT354_18190 [Gemmatimonadaceae bacterium]|nr:hypothetical protein [Gemmatimonadaceae bacterium]